MSFPKMTPFRVFRYNKDFSENYVDVFNNGIITDVNDPSYHGVETFGGWCNPDTGTGSAVVYLGDRFEVGYVRYTRTVPAKALKFAVEKAVNNEKESTGGKVVSRARKREIKEQIKLRMLCSAPVQPTVFRVEINPSSMEIAVFSASNAVLEEIKDKIRCDFGIDMYMETIVDHIPDDDMVEVESVGEHFLTWLWYVSETDSFNTFESIKNPSKSYTVSPDDRVVVGNTDTGKCSVSGDIREAKNGVFNGKGVTQFSFVLYPASNMDGDHTPVPCVVNSGCLVDRVSFKGLPLSGKSEDSDAEADALMCLDTIEDVRDFIKSAFSRFWKSYSDAKEWQSLRREIWTWARGDVCIRAFEGV